MIIKEHQLEKLISESVLPPNILIYGPNEGLVREYVEKITNTYLNKDDYEKINLSGKDLDNDPQALNDITRTVSMFFNNKVIIADSIKASLDNFSASKYPIALSFIGLVGKG